MKLTFTPLLEEAGKPEYREYASVLRHLALLHENSLYQPESCPLAWPLETLGPGYYFAPAFSHWDLTYALLDSCQVMPEHTLHQLENMLYFQQPDGFLPGAIFFRGGDVVEKPEPHWYSTFPPVWVLAADACIKAAGDTRAAQLCFEPLCRQIKWFEENRRADKFGFFYMDTLIPKTWESGVDESIRCQVVEERGKFPCVDATSHLRLLYDAAARWARLLGKESAEFESQKAELDTIIQEHFFCKETGFFHDAYLLERNIKFRTLTGIWPLVCGAATQEQADRVINESLLDPKRFFTKHPLPYVAADEPYFELKMWRGGAWNSLTYMAVLGCLRYNRYDAAEQIARRVLHWSEAWFRRTGAIWEFYHPHGDSPTTMGRKRAPYLLPCREYLGHNPLFALARICAGNFER